MKPIGRVLAVCAGLLGLTGAALAAGVDELPADIQDRLYNKDQIDPQQPIGASAYRDWKPKKGPPWTIGYASSYAGNTWRAAALEKLEKELIPQVEEARVDQGRHCHPIQPEGLGANSTDASTRRSRRRRADNLLFEPDGAQRDGQIRLRQGRADLFHGRLRNIPLRRKFLDQLRGHRQDTWATGWSTRSARRATCSWSRAFPAPAPRTSLDRGIKLGLATRPDVKIVGDVAGMWTDQVAQAEVQKWLANHPGDLDGVVVQSAAELGVLRALEQSGRKMPPVAIGGEEGALCYWRHHPKYISAAIQGWPPADEMELAWNIMMRTMEGQGPKIESVLVELDKAQLRRCGASFAGDLQRGFRQVVHSRRRQMGRNEETGRLSSCAPPIRKPSSTDERLSGPRRRIAKRGVSDPRPREVGFAKPRRRRNGERAAGSRPRVFGE